jgi:hypothetical protein
VQQNGLRGLARGYPACALRDATWTLSLFGFTPIIQDFLINKYDMNISVAGLAASLAAGSLCGVVTCPFDVIKTSQAGDIEKKKYTNFWQTLKKQRKRLFSGWDWRVANVVGTIMIANEFRVRVAPLMFPDKYAKEISDHE